MKLDKKAFGLASGIFWGFTIFVATIWVLIRGGGETLILLRQFYFGYSVSYEGAFVGLIYGLVDGFVCGWIFAWLYNKG
jgi:hypothetical protein